MQDIGITMLEQIGDDKSIHFRPSPNFKHMKKYLKSKYEEESCYTTAPYDQQLSNEEGNEVDYLRSKLEEFIYSATAAHDQQLSYRQHKNKTNYSNSKLEEATLSATAENDQQLTYSEHKKANYSNSKLEEATHSATAAHDQQLTYRQHKNKTNYSNSKLEEATLSATAANDQQFFTNKEDGKANLNVASQPPLPPGTPPLEYPTNFILKQEVVDHGYEIDNVIQHQNVTPTGIDTITTQIQTGEVRKKIMCKDFVRGTCKRNPCNYNHELDLTQLKGVYKFCRDFANGKCRRTVCFFVHASIFEQEKFFRTGLLPAHTMRHFKDSAIAQQPQPVSDAPPQAFFMPVYPVPSGIPANPTQSGYNSCSSLSPEMTVPAEPALDPTMCNTLHSHHQRPSNQRRNEADGAGNAEDAPTQCVNCKMAEISYQQKQAKLEGLVRSTEKIKENIAKMEQKKANLLAVLTMLLCNDGTSKF